MPDERTEIAILKTRMDEMEKNMNQRFDRLENTLSKFIDNSEDRFSAKWVENAVKWVAIIIVGAVLVAIIGLVIKDTTKNGVEKINSSQLA